MASGGASTDWLARKTANCRLAAAFEEVGPLVVLPFAIGREARAAVFGQNFFLTQPEASFDVQVQLSMDPTRPLGALHAAAGSSPGRTENSSSRS